MARVFVTIVKTVSNTQEAEDFVLDVKTKLVDNLAEGDTHMSAKINSDVEV